MQRLLTTAFSAGLQQSILAQRSIGLLGLSMHRRIIQVLSGTNKCKSGLRVMAVLVINQHVVLLVLLTFCTLCSSRLPARSPAERHSCCNSVVLCRFMSDVPYAHASRLQAIMPFLVKAQDGKAVPWLLAGLMQCTESKGPESLELQSPEAVQQWCNCLQQPEVSWARLAEYYSTAAKLAAMLSLMQCGHVGHVC